MREMLVELVEVDDWVMVVKDYQRVNWWLQELLFLDIRWDIESEVGEDLVLG